MLFATEKGFAQEKGITPFVSGGTHLAFVLKGNTTALFDGFNGRVGVRKSLREQIDISTSAGILQFDNHKYYPLSVAGHFRLKKNSSNFISYHLGYSVAQFAPHTANGFQDLHGGLMHSLAWEKSLFSLKDLNFYLEFAACYQRGSYQTEHYETNFGLTSLRLNLTVEF